MDAGEIALSVPSSLYRPSLALLTDLYQVTMAYSYWKAGVHEREAVFNLFFRSNPFGGGYTVTCGLEHVVDFLKHFRFAKDDLDYLASLRGNDGKPLFDAAFLKYLERVPFTCDVDAIPEGTVVFPPEPLVRVRGAIAQCQIVESALLNLVNFQSLIATKAARVCSAAEGDVIVEFGLRRAQGIDGALAASRAAYIGGCPATSNMLAGKLLGIPVRGTHAHSWVMFFESEREAFLEYAKAMPNNCIFLVDTYDTLGGVRNAVEAGRWLREQGHEMIGIRLDSGDLAYLSIETRKILDEAGFPDATILASNELDERIIESLKSQGARIGVWGVGTRLVTGYGQPALGGIYKLSAIRDSHGAWQYKLKLSEQSIKVSYPGILQVRRFHTNGELIADAIYDEPTGIDGTCTLVDPLDLTRRKTVPADTSFDDLLVPVFRNGRPVYDPPPLAEVREHARSQLERLHSGIKRFVHPHQYPVGLEQELHDLRTRLTLRARGS
jgi:nicotinate phosphoribosyltransferase